MTDTENSDNLQLNCSKAVISPLAAVRLHVDNTSQELIFEERKLDYLEDSVKQQPHIQFFLLKHQIDW